jgi:hypothetical protein
MWSFYTPPRISGTEITRFKPASHRTRHIIPLDKVYRAMGDGGYFLENYLRPPLRAYRYNVKNWFGNTLAFRQLTEKFI